MVEGVVDARLEAELVGWVEAALDAGQLEWVEGLEAGARLGAGLVEQAEGLEAGVAEGVVDSGLETELVGWVLEAGHDGGQVE